jgi:hypothetical protein
MLGHRRLFAFRDSLYQEPGRCDKLLFSEFFDATAPLDASTIQAVTPSDVGSGTVSNLKRLQAPMEAGISDHVWSLDEVIDLL